MLRAGKEWIMTIERTAHGIATCPVRTDRISLSECTFTDPAIQEHPTAFYRALRETDPVHFDEKLGMYLVSRYEDLETVFRDPVTYSQELGYNKQMAHGHLDEMKAILERDGGGFFPDVANIDPPRHARVRKLLQQAFTARRMKTLEPEFEALVNDLIDGFIDRGDADGLRDLALPMAIGFSQNQLQVPDLAQDTIRRWGAAYLSQFSLMQSREEAIAVAAQLCELQNYLIALVRTRMANPGDDMLSDLIAARIEDENPALSFEELVATARAILINTHDSVSTAMINILFAVATTPTIASQFYAAADNDSRMGRLIEEVLRLEPPVRALSRITTKPVTLAGVDLPKGAHLLVLFASANDDETIFAAAREFNMDRSNLTKTMTFGAGIHLCLGISLARMQLRVAAKQIARRMHDIKLAIPVEDIRYLPNVALLTMEELPLTFN
jgi:cytochrome P450